MPSTGTKPDTGEQKKGAEIEDIMEIVVAYPPNFDLIKAALPMASKDHTFCYAEKIYNPSGKELPADIQYHEYIHSIQQGEYPGGPDAWWNRYLMDRQFRLDQELDAYGQQYQFAKENLYKADRDIRSMTKDQDGKEIKAGSVHLAGGVNNILREVLFSMAKALSGEEYGDLLSFSEAEAAIKRYGK